MLPGSELRGLFGWYDLGLVVVDEERFGTSQRDALAKHALSDLGKRRLVDARAKLRITVRWGRRKKFKQRRLRRQRRCPVAEVRTSSPRQPRPFRGLSRSWPTGTAACPCCRRSLQARCRSGRACIACGHHRHHPQARLAGTALQQKEDGVGEIAAEVAARVRAGRRRRKRRGVRACEAATFPSDNEGHSMDQVFWSASHRRYDICQARASWRLGGELNEAAVGANEVEEEYGGDEGVWQDDDDSDDDDDDDVNNEGTAAEEGPSTRIDCEDSACRGDDEVEASCLEAGLLVNRVDDESPAAQSSVTARYAYLKDHPAFLWGAGEGTDEGGAGPIRVGMIHGRTPARRSALGSWESSRSGRSTSWWLPPWWRWGCTCRERRSWSWSTRNILSSRSSTNSGGASGAVSARRTVVLRRRATTILRRVHFAAWPRRRGATPKEKRTAKVAEAELSIDSDSWRRLQMALRLLRLTSLCADRGIYWV